MYIGHNHQPLAGLNLAEQMRDAGCQLPERVLDALALAEATRRVQNKDRDDLGVMLARGDITPENVGDVLRERVLSHAADSGVPATAGDVINWLNRNVALPALVAEADTVCAHLQKSFAPIAKIIEEAAPHIDALGSPEEVLKAGPDAAKAYYALVDVDAALMKINSHRVDVYNIAGGAQRGAAWFVKDVPDVEVLHKCDQALKDPDMMSGIVTTSNFGANRALPDLVRSLVIMVKLGATLHLNSPTQARDMVARAVASSKKLDAIKESEDPSFITFKAWYENLMAYYDRIATTPAK